MERTFCDNHDDGTTEAASNCGDCHMNLCVECDQVMHLPKAMVRVSRALDPRVLNIPPSLSPSVCCYFFSVFLLLLLQRGHGRSALERADPNLQLEMHEGCGRVKLARITALCDRRNFRGVVEFRSQTFGATCRFCGRFVVLDCKLHSLKSNFPPRLLFSVPVSCRKVPAWLRCPSAA